MISPSGPRAAGKYGCSLLSIGATQRAGIDLLGQHWDVMEERAGRVRHSPPTGASWRLVTRCTWPRPRSRPTRTSSYGLGDYVQYFREVAALPIFPDGPADQLADQLNSTGGGVIGTPDDAIDLDRAARRASPTAGSARILIQAHEWANPEATRRELRAVRPVRAAPLRRHTASTTASMEHVMANRPEHMGAADERHRRRHPAARGREGAEPAADVAGSPADGG